MRLRAYSRALGSVLAAFVVTMLSAEAGAQDTTDKGNLAISRLLPAPAGDRMFGVQSPFVAGNLEVHGMLLVDYANKPLVLYSTAKDDTVGDIVENQLFLHASVTLALWNRLQISADMPFALFQSGTPPTGFESQFAAPSTAIGDLQLAP